MNIDYKTYVKKDLWDEFKKHCRANSLDFYSCGCILTAHLVMQSLMQHKEKTPKKKRFFKGATLAKADKVTPEGAWKDAMDSTPYHSGFSASCTAQTIIHYSPRGKEFKKWWKKTHESQ